MSSWIMFDKDDRAVGITSPLGEQPSPKTLSRFRAKYAQPLNKCTRDQYEEAVRGRREAHQLYSGQRRKLKKLQG